MILLFVMKLRDYEFADALANTCGSCIYLKHIKKNNFVSTALVASKSRAVQNKKKMKLLRMELLGNFILSKLLIRVIDYFNKKFDISKILDGVILFE